MKSVQFAQYSGPEVLQVHDVPDPIPGPEDVLIQVKATTVNHLDLFQRDGSRPVPSLPFTPGLEAAGVVLKDNQGFRTGDRVMTTRAIAAKGGGGYASRIAAPATDQCAFLMRFHLKRQWQQASHLPLHGEVYSI